MSNQPVGKKAGGSEAETKHEPLSGQKEEISECRGDKARGKDLQILWKGCGLMGFKKLLITIFSLSLLVACATPSVRVTSLVPGKFHEAATLKEVAVLPFDGNNGKEFAVELEAILSNVIINEKQYFTLIERTKIDRLINEMSLSQTGLVDNSTATKIGKMLGAKGIYTGVVTQPQVTNTPWQEERTECVSYEQTKKFFKKCLNERRYNVRCVKKVATFEFTPKLSEVETGRVVYANNISGTASSSACSDSLKPITPDFELIQSAKKAAMEKFKQDIAPHLVTFNIHLIESTDGITSAEAENKFKQGIDFAKGSRFGRACELWTEARVLSPNSPSILYSLGICAEMTGSPGEALDLYKKAERLLDKPDTNISMAIARCSEIVRRQQKLKEQISR